MASRLQNSHSRSQKRAVPYDLNLPVNWTAAKLRTEIAVLGVNLTSQSIPKSALVQIYEQLSASKDKQTQGLVNSEGQDTVPASHDVVINSQPVHSIDSQDNITRITDTAPIQPISPVLPGVSNDIVAGTSNSLPAQDLQDQNSQAGLLRSTLGMISTMQGTIASLQSTINNLVQKQAPGSGINNLEQFYKGADIGPSNSVQNNSVQCHGVAADSLPHIDVVSDSIRKNITAGKYVNLACLLIPEFEVTKLHTENLSGLDFLKHQQRDHRLDRALTITQFFKAFGIYKRIMCEAFPQRRDELDLYEADIGNIYEHYGEIFYQYHVQFSRRAAAYMEKGIKVDWSKRHKDLFQLLIGGNKTKLCEHCSQADHQSPFCPTQINVQRPSKQKSYPSLDLSKDSYGRPRVSFKGKEICNNFNADKGCTRSACPFEHICKKCKGAGHGQLSCQPQTVTGSELSHSAADKAKQKPAM